MSAVAHVGRVPRERYIFIPASALKFPELPADHPMVDEGGNSVTRDDEGGCEQIIVRQQCPYLMLQHAIAHYAVEHLQAEGRDPRRMNIVAKHAFRIWAPQDDVTKLDRAKVRHYTATRTAEGACGATIRRELSLVQAALNHNVREERMKVAPKFVKPKPSEPRARWLTREEHFRLMAQPMEYRTRMFFLLAFGAGARSKAIEELTWDRIDWQARTVDFRVPGVVYRNKRRVIAPIGDVLFRRLEAAYARPNRDEYVIGRGPKGAVSCTFRKCKAVFAAIGINEEGVARHVARHTFCSWLIQAGASYAKVGRLVGDKAAMIEKVYGHLSPEHVRDEANLALLH